MANKPAPALPLRDGDQAILEKVVRSSATTAGAAQRARIVLLASQGVANALISEWVEVSRSAVNSVVGPLSGGVGWHPASGLIEGG